jgi:DNA-binding XRE family transcriptional regulator
MAATRVPACFPTSPHPRNMHAIRIHPPFAKQIERDNRDVHCGISNPPQAPFVMKHRHPICYLRTHRRVWGLSQAELARLLGLGPSCVYRLERSKCKSGPSYETALACQVLFGIEPRDMYPTIHRQVEDRVIQACYLMHQGMEHSTSLLDLRKRELLELALRRALTRDSSARVV